MELTRRFAKFISKTEFDSLPEGIVSCAKERLLDTVGAMLAGRADWAYGDALIAAEKNLGGGSWAVIGPDAVSRFPAARAAMLDATFAHAVELDDGHKYAGVHAGAVVIPTALTMGAEFGASGKEILAAIVSGYEISYRLAVAQSPELIDRGFHPSATCDTVAAMAVAGKLMRLSEEQLANGLGMSGLQAAGLMEATVSGQQSKCVMVGNAAFNGISCAYVARQGLEGTTSAFEGKTGLFQAMSKPLDPDRICEDLGMIYLIPDTYNKFYPTCRHSQPAIEAVINQAVAHSIDPAQVDHVDVGTHRVACKLTGVIHEPHNPGEAKFSIPYGVAVGLIDHGVAVRHLREAAFTDARYLELAARVNVRIDDSVNALYPKQRGARIRIVLKDGTAYEETCYHLKGSPQNPVGFDALVDKFRTSAEGLLSPENTETLIKRCEAFDRETDVKTFLTLLNW